jgi:hypothetical protein
VLQFSFFDNALCRSLAPSVPSAKFEEISHQLSSLNMPAALYFARSSHHDVDALLRLGKVAGSVLHSHISCPQPDTLDNLDMRVFLIGCALASGFSMVRRENDLFEVFCNVLHSAYTRCTSC